MIRKYLLSLGFLALFGSAACLSTDPTTANNPSGGNSPSDNPGTTNPGPSNNPTSNDPGTIATIPDPGAVNDPGNTPTTTPTPMACSAGQTYKGFDGLSLTRSRLTTPVGTDRNRVKPYSALSADYTRVLGAAPALAATSASSFPTAAARWFVEPFSGAVPLYTSMQIAFQGCLAFVKNDAALATAPNATNAADACGKFATTFWNRTATADQIAACSKLAVTDTASETDPGRRWAYTCASVLNSADFLTY